MRARTHWRPLPAALLAVCLLARPAVVNAAAPADADALRQKTEEVERLKRELDLREQELRQLQQDNERLRKEQEKQERQRQKQQERNEQHEIQQLRNENERLRREQPRPDGATAVSPAARVLPPITPIQNLPPLAPDSVVDVDELVSHFLTEPDAARRRYADRIFRVQGEVDRFDRAMVTREFSVMLVSPDRATTVKFRFNYVDQYSTVFTAKDGRELVARHAPGSQTTLLTVGDRVVLAGRCQGLKDGTITFARGEIVR